MERPLNHYDWLDKNLATFLHNVGVDSEYSKTLPSAHGDKCYSYRIFWESHNIHFFHGVALYLLTYCYPFSKECRETDKGWVSPVDWVIMNKDRFLPYLPPIV